MISSFFSFHPTAVRLLRQTIAVTTESGGPKELDRKGGV